jgi:hypothetical protein
MKTQKFENTVIMNNKLKRSIQSMEMKGIECYFPTLTVCFGVSQNLKEAIPFMKKIYTGDIFFFSVLGNNGDAFYQLGIENSNYNKISDFWEIPQIVLKMNGKSSLFLIRYTDVWSVTILFFKPIKQLI